jgi:methylmalonyl-CoA mutase cobalamin-binding subunit
MAAAGGWQALPAGPTLKPEMSDARVPALRQRLQAEQLLSGGGKGEGYEATLVAAVTEFQRRHGLSADGALGAGTVAALNVPVDARINSLRLNMERLRWVFRDLQPEFTRDTRPQSRSRRILLVIAPGEQHGFGRDMLAGFFRHAGWDVVAPPPGSVADFAAVIRQESFEVVGFSAATDTRLDAVATCIRAVRKSARNHACGIMVGGPIFIARPENVALVGAAATAADGQQATLQAERMMTLMTHRD